MVIGYHSRRQTVGSISAWVGSFIPYSSSLITGFSLCTGHMWGSVSSQKMSWERMPVIGGTTWKDKSSLTQKVSLWYHPFIGNQRMLWVRTESASIPNSILQSPTDSDSSGECDPSRQSKHTWNSKAKIISSLSHPMCQSTWTAFTRKKKKAKMLRRAEQLPSQVGGCCYGDCESLIQHERNGW